MDPAFKQELGLDREGFEDATCLLRGAVTHDGLPFSLPAPLQPLVFALVLTHWRMELDRPGDLSSYAVFTQHADAGVYTRTRTDFRRKWSKRVASCRND
ncbi:MAG: hypothetical protein ABSG78_00800 [Verrucomicrobiota bacterium]